MDKYKLVVHLTNVLHTFVYCKSYQQRATLLHFSGNINCSVDYNDTFHSVLFNPI